MFFRPALRTSPPRGPSPAIPSSNGSFRQARSKVRIPFSSLKRPTKSARGAPPFARGSGGTPALRGSSTKLGFTLIRSAAKPPRTKRDFANSLSAMKRETRRFHVSSRRWRSTIRATGSEARRAGKASR